MSTDAKPTVDPFAGLPAIFRDCSDPESNRRYDLRYPCVQAGYVYAADGRIIVRMPWTGEEPPEWTAMREGRFPRDAASIYNSGHADTETPIPPDMHRDPVTCSRCKGTKVEECEECFGDDEDCEECGGSGQTECYWCDGAGEFDHEDYDEPVQVGHMWFHRRLLALLQKHGVTGLYLPPRPFASDADRATKFVLGEVEGRLMPMTDPR